MKEDIEGEIAEFQSKCWPDAEVFIDDAKSMYRVASSGELVKQTGLCSFICKVTCCQRSRGKALNQSMKEYGGNVTGEGFILGSLLVVDTKGEIKYAHAEQAFDDHPNFSDVVQAAIAAALRTAPDLPSDGGKAAAHVPAAGVASPSAGA